jgi:hypothetical protein
VSYMAKWLKSSRRGVLENSSKKVRELAHLRDACLSLRDYAVTVTWPRDRRVKVQDSYLPSSE